MGLDIGKLVRKIAYPTVNKLTKKGQPTVWLRRFVSQDTEGKVTYGSKTAYGALVDYRTRKVVRSDGQEVASSVTVNFLYPIVIGVKDELTLPDGRIIPIVAVSGFIDPLTNDGYAKDVYLG